MLTDDHSSYSFIGRAVDIAIVTFLFLYSLQSSAIDARVSAIHSGLDT